MHRSRWLGVSNGELLGILFAQSFLRNPPIIFGNTAKAAQSQEPLQFAADSDALQPFSGSTTHNLDLVPAFLNVFQRSVHARQRS